MARLSDAVEVGLPADEAIANVLERRTLANLHNERPAWLADAHRRLDEAVSAACGWSQDIVDDVRLATLSDPTLARAAAQSVPDAQSSTAT